MELYNQVHKLIAQWFKHRQIAQKLNISVWAVSDIRNNKYKKQQIQSELVSEFNPQATQEELTELDKILEKLQKKWIVVNVDIWWMKPSHIPQAMAPFVWWDPENVLVISDIHAPFVLDWYLQHCREQQEMWNCWTVVYIWDIIDFHSISYHEKIPEQLNPAWEWAKAKLVLADWYSTFPNATVLMGNHDLLVYRQARTAWLLREFIKDPNTIFWAPSTYKFVDELIIDSVLYTHGSTGNAFKKCILENMNMVSWHAHTQCWVIYHQNRHWQKRWMQVWVGIDYKQQAFDYAKSNSKYPVNACAVVLDSWTLPIVLPFLH